MHRATLQAFRASYHSKVRGLSRARLGRLSFFLPNHAPVRFFNLPPPNSTSRVSQHAVVPLRSSMYFRRFSVALASTLVGCGAWYAYKTPGGVGDVPARSFSSTQTQTALDSAPTRNVLVISANELHTGTFVGEGPISKMTGNDGKMIIEMLGSDDVTTKLRQLEQSYLVNRGQGVVRYDLVQLPSNNPIEDDHAEKIVEVSAPRSAKDSTINDWMFWGVFDGHSGWTTSAKLRQSLINFVARELNETYLADPNQSPSEDAIEKAIKTGFTRLDDEIVHQSVEKVFKAKSKRLAAEALAPALAGSCALLSFYDSRSKLLRVACTGDSRAVLGRRSDSGKWTATPLSVDQTGSNPNEEKRMRALHPGEDRVIHNGRVLGGLEPTRAFGDASYKWTREVTDRLKQSFFARSANPLLKTPPYVTAEPVVTTTKIQPENGDFLVLATDGLWEMLTNDEVVGLVGKWVETQQAKERTKSQFDYAWAKIFGSSQTDLPVEAAKPSAKSGGDGQKVPIRLRQWGISPDDKGRFVVKDSNAATHLVRNALGGSNEEQVSALLTLPAPFSRRYRDDLTVQVIFFGDGEKKGEVVLNLDDMAPAQDPKPKL